MYLKGGKGKATVLRIKQIIITKNRAALALAAKAGEVAAAATGEPASGAATT